MKRLAILLFPVFTLCLLAQLTFAEVLRDIRFDGRPLEELGIEAKSSFGDYQGVITQLPETQIEGQTCCPWLLYNRTGRSWTALVADLKGLKLPIGTRVRLTVWAKSNRPGYVRVALSEGVSYGGDCRLLSRGKAMFPFVRQALVLERTLVEESELLSAAVGIDYNSAGAWVAVDRICVETLTNNELVAPGAMAAADYTELRITSAEANLIAEDVEQQLAVTRREIAELEAAGYGEHESVVRRREATRRLEEFLAGRVDAINLLEVVQGGEHGWYADAVQLQLQPELFDFTRTSTLLPESSECWLARAPQGGHDGAVMLVSNRSCHPLVYQLTLQGDICKLLKLSRLSWVDDRADCVVETAMDTLHEIPADAIQAYALEFRAGELPPGIYEGEVVLMPLDERFPVRKTKLSFEVLPWQMPAQMPVRTFLFDYGNALRPEMAPLMKEGRLNTIQFNLDGRDLTKIEKYTRQIEAAGLREGCFAYIEEWFTREEGWHEKDDEWLDQLVAEMERNGWSYDEWCLHIFDEVFGDLFLECAKAIKAHNPKVQIFSDMLVTDLEVLERFNPYLDFYCPHIRTQVAPERAIYQEAIDYIYVSGHPVWLYDCDSCAVHPLDLARAISWCAWLDGAKGITYWALIASRLRAPEAGVENWGMTYPLGEKWIPSRRLLMYFAGLEDYLLLERAAELQPERTRAIAQMVLNAFTFDQNTMCQAHYAAHQELLGIIAGGQ
ncbi:MAG: hypothetical protein J5654_09770 [Victivallales bacterium]|nr:hypothetical protein [Victivallales bacterium]